MITGYYQHCTFFAVYRDTKNVIYSSSTFVEEALESPRAFYDWVEYRRKALAAQVGTSVIVVEMRVMPPIITNFYGEIQN